MFMTQLQSVYNVLTMYNVLKAFNYALSATYVATIKFNRCKPWISSDDLAMNSLVQIAN